MLAHIFAYFGPFDTRSHKVANLAYCSKICYKEQRIRIIIGQITEMDKETYHGTLGQGTLPNLARKENAHPNTGRKFDPRRKCPRLKVT